MSVDGGRFARLSLRQTGCSIVILTTLAALKSSPAEIGQSKGLAA